MPGVFILDYKEQWPGNEYIEKLREIDLSACANANGYSKYHFLRVQGSVRDDARRLYTKRRLSEI